MLPAAGLERARGAGDEQSEGGAAGAVTQDAADAGDGNAGDPGGYAAGRRCGEQEFVILAAVEGLLKGSAGSKRDGGGVELGGDAGFLADVGKISGEAVADVDGRGRCGAGLQPGALREARLRIEVWIELAGAGGWDS